jgi:hypothetical protein
MNRAQSDPRMGYLLERLYYHWYSNGGTLFNAFTYCSTPSQYGFWGHLQYLGEPQAEATKYAALMCVISRYCTTR